MTGTPLHHALAIAALMPLPGIDREILPARPRVTPEAKRAGDEIAARLREERRQRKAENFAKRQPKGKA